MFDPEWHFFELSFQYGFKLVEQELQFSRFIVVFEQSQLIRPELFIKQF